MTTHEIKTEIRAYDITSFSQAFKIGRTKVYEEIKSGRLKTLKVGRRRIIPIESVNKWVALLTDETEI